MRYIERSMNGFIQFHAEYVFELSTKFTEHRPN